MHINRRQPDAEPFRHALRRPLSPTLPKNIERNWSGCHGRPFPLWKDHKFHFKARVSVRLRVARYVRMVTSASPPAMPPVDYAPGHVPSISTQSVEMRSETNSYSPKKCSCCSRCCWRVFLERRLRKVFCARTLLARLINFCHCLRRIQTLNFISARMWQT